MSASSAPKPSQTALRRDWWNTLGVSGIALRARRDQSAFFAIRFPRRWGREILLSVHGYAAEEFDASRNSRSAFISPSTGCRDAFMLNGPVEQVPKCDREFVWETRLHEEAGTALMLGAFTQRWFVVAGKQDDRNLSSSRLTLQIVK
jgi:hypothetical protein